MAYRLGDDAVVQPFVDEEFEQNRSAALLPLNDKRFGEARADFDRALFPAVETAAKVLFPGTARFMPNEIDKLLMPRLEAKYAGNQPALDAGRALLRGFREWITAAQPYRHGQGVQEPAEPPEDFVVAHLSAGATYLRWMIELSDPE